MPKILRRDFLLLLPLVCNSGSLAQELPTWSEPDVEYSAVPADAARKIVLERLSTSAVPPPGNKTLSELKSRWFVQRGPDYTSTAPPWNTTFYIGKQSSSRPLLLLKALDHGNTVWARWINEELLFVEVWWGRFGSSDLIVNVDKVKLIYSKLARYEP